MGGQHAGRRFAAVVSVGLSAGEGDELTSLLELEGQLQKLAVHVAHPRQLDPLTDMSGLVELVVSTRSSARYELDLGAWESITHLTVGCRPSLVPLLELPQLSTVVLTEWPDQTFDRLPANAAWRRLDIGPGGRLRSLTGLERLAGLERFQVAYQTRLVDFSAISSQAKLAYLGLIACKRLGSLDFVTGLKALRSLTVDNCGVIESLQPLSATPELRRLYAPDSTTVADGDLSVLLELAQLEFLALVNRRQYAPTVRQVREALGIQGADDPGDASG